MARLEPSGRADRQQPRGLRDRPGFLAQACGAGGGPDSGAAAIPLVASSPRNGSGKVMLREAISALEEWDKAGLSIDRVGVNISEEDLRKPGFSDRVALMLDRAEMAPERLCIEVLETVVSEGQED